MLIHDRYGVLTDIIMESMHVYIYAYREWSVVLIYYSIVNVFKQFGGLNWANELKKSFLPNRLYIINASMLASFEQDKMFPDLKKVLSKI